MNARLQARNYEEGNANHRCRLSPLPGKSSCSETWKRRRTTGEVGMRQQRNYKSAMKRYLKVLEIAGVQRSNDVALRG